MKVSDASSFGGSFDAISIIRIFSGKPTISTTEQRVDELLYRLRREGAMCDGAKNMVRILQQNKQTDKKSLQDVRF